MLILLPVCEAALDCVAADHISKLTQGKKGMWNAASCLHACDSG